jgi:hypothetical protein
LSFTTPDVIFINTHQWADYNTNTFVS